MNEHGAALGMNLVFVVLAVALVTHNVPRVFPWLLAFAALPVGIVYLVSQRRVDPFA